MNVCLFFNIDVADSQISVNQSYQQSYSNSSSLEFKNFSETFCTEVGTAFLFMIKKSINIELIERTLQINKHS